MAEGDRQCKACGSTDGLTFVAITSDDGDEVDLEEDESLWLCEEHYMKLTESDRYRIRELPAPSYFKRNQRFTVEDEVVLLHPENEEEWIQFPKSLEMFLSNER